MSLQRWKELAGKKKKVEQYYEDWYDKVKDYKFKRAASTDFYRRSTKPITEKNEEQTKKIEEQTEKQLTLVPDLIKFDEPPNVPALLDAPTPEKAARPKVGMTIVIDADIDEDIIKDRYNLKMPSEMIGKNQKNYTR